MVERFKLRIADFSTTPFGRYRSDGPKSGEVFRDDVLEPAIMNHDKVELILDGVAGLPSSFWEEALGGLIRKGWKSEVLRQKLDLIASDRDLQVFVRLGWRYIAEAKPSTRPGRR